MSVPLHMFRFIRALPAILAAIACSSGTPGPSGPDDPGPPSAALAGDVLFIGNSLTESNDLPGIVQALAESAGTPGLRTAAIVAGGAALEDHSRSTLILQTIAQGNWRFVVLQQGPSSLPESRANLREWTARFAERIRAAGGEPALYTVWPEESRFEFFDDVIESYRLAAEDIPAATAAILQQAAEQALAARSAPLSQRLR